MNKRQTTNTFPTSKNMVLYDVMIMVHHGPSHLLLVSTDFFASTRSQSTGNFPKTSGPGSMLSKAPGEPVLFFSHITIGSTGFWWCLGGGRNVRISGRFEFWFWFRPPDFGPTQRIMVLHGLEDVFLGKTMCRYTFLILDGREVHCWGWKISLFRGWSDLS